MTEPALSIERLSVSLPRGADRAHAVKDVSLEVGRGEVVCICQRAAFMLKKPKA